MNNYELCNFKEQFHITYVQTLQSLPRQWQKNNDLSPPLSGRVFGGGCGSAPSTSTCRPCGTARTGALGQGNAHCAFRACFVLSTRWSTVGKTQIYSGRLTTVEEIYICLLIYFEYIRVTHKSNINYKECIQDQEMSISMKNACILK